MDLFDAMSTCRAMSYLKSDPVDTDLINKVITAATWAPSPGNSQGRDFLIVTDDTKKKKIGDAIETAMTSRVAAMERPDKLPWAYARRNGTSRCDIEELPCPYFYLW